MTILVNNIVRYYGGTTNESVSVATLNPATMELLSLFRGDTIIVRCVVP